MAAAVGWLLVNRDQLQAQRSETSMEERYLTDDTQTNRQHFVTAERCIGTVS